MLGLEGSLLATMDIVEALCQEFGLLPLSTHLNPAEETCEVHLSCHRYLLDRDKATLLPCLFLQRRPLSNIPPFPFLSFCFVLFIFFPQSMLAKSNSLLADHTRPIVKGFCDSLEAEDVLGTWSAWATCTSRGMRVRNSPKFWVIKIMSKHGVLQCF